MITLILMVNKMLCLIKYSSFLIILKLGGWGGGGDGKSVLDFQKH